MAHGSLSGGERERAEKGGCREGDGPPAARAVKNRQGEEANEEREGEATALLGTSREQGGWDGAVPPAAGGSGKGGDTAASCRCRPRDGRRSRVGASLAHGRRSPIVGRFATQQGEEEWTIRFSAKMLPRAGVVKGLRFFYLI